MIRRIAVALFLSAIAASAASPPNLIIVLADDLGYGDLAGYGHPKFARWPGKIPAGHVSAQPAVMMDMFATALAAAGVTSPAGREIDGRNILPLFTSNASSPHEAIFGHGSATNAGPTVSERF